MVRPFLEGDEDIHLFDYMVVHMVVLHGFPSLNNRAHKILAAFGRRGKDEKRVNRDWTTEDCREEGSIVVERLDNGRKSRFHCCKRRRRSMIVWLVVVVVVVVAETEIYFFFCNHL